MISEGRKAIALLSGGLDSLLSVAVVSAQGIAVEALHFYTGFSVVERQRRLGREHDAHGNAMRRSCDQMGAALRFIDVSQEYLEVVLHPRYGYGKGVNPCIDCHLFMLRKAHQHMVATGADFVITGEVLGQRPMSQHRSALRLLERESDLEGLLLRPLSARVLPLSTPEKLGWVDRNRLYAFQGRGRGPQIRLAEELSLRDYPQPAGGCLLTDASYARRFSDLIAHIEGQNVTSADMVLLGIGRHFRISTRVKCIVGRDEAENHFLDRARGSRARLTARDHVGPVALIEGAPCHEEVLTIAGITARYSDARNDQLAIMVCDVKGNQEILRVKPMPLEKVHSYMI